MKTQHHRLLGAEATGAKIQEENKLEHETAVFIIIATMETLIQFKEKAKKKETEKKEA